MAFLSKYLFRHTIQTILIIILFYTVGIGGIVLPITQSFFIALIPFALLSSFVLILLYHRSSKNRNEFVFFIFVFGLSYLIEVVGVNTHFPFGNYSYGSGLGVKVFGTPLMIGINWVMLVYCSASILERTGWGPVIQVLSASSLMVLYDLVLEHVAPKLEMWSWAGNSVPFQNYMAWFTLGISFHAFLKFMKIRTLNPVAPAIFICQFLFFITIMTFVK